MVFELNMVQTAGFAVLVLLLGQFLRDRIKVFQTFAIPSPVIGGLLFAIINLFLKQKNIVELNFDFVLKDFFMIIFFTTIGFNASFRILKAGGPNVIKFLFVATLLCVLQNAVAIGLAGFINIDPKLALMTGSTPMTGGHGTAAGISPAINAIVDRAETIAITSATFGLVAGSLIGGPIASFLIKKDNLIEKRKSEKIVTFDDDIIEDEIKCLDLDRATRGFFIILIAMALGTYISNFLNSIVGNYTDLAKFPAYLGPMVLAILFRNFLPSKARGAKKDWVPNDEIQIIGDISLNIFLAMALMDLKLWQLASVAGQLSILLIAQTFLMALFAMFITYKVMGSNYDAAVLAAGHCGFGMGATPNGVANMQSVTQKYVNSRLAFFVLPIVGGMFIDFVNVGIITGFLMFV